MTTLQTFFRNHRIEIYICILALIVRCLCLGLSIQAHQGDVIKTVQGSDGYYAISQNILHGNGFSSNSTPPYTLNSFRPPLQPYFLASTSSFFGSYWGPIILLLLIGSIIPLLAMRIARYLFESRAIIIGTGIALALEPSAVLLSTVFYSETLFTFFLLLSLLYAFKYIKNEIWYHGLFSAALLGIATLTRAVTEYLPIVLVILFLVHFRKQLTGRRILAAVAYLGVFLVVISPWLYRNYRDFHAIGITSEEGVTLYTVIIPSVLSIEHGTSFQQEYTAWTAGGVKGPNEATIDLSSQYVRKAIPVLLAHPVGLALLSGNTFFSFFTADGMRDFLNSLGAKPDKLLGKPALFLLFSNPAKLFGLIGYYATKPAILILIMRALWFCITILFFAGAVRSVRRNGFTLSNAVALGTVLYFALITLTVGLGVNARYRVPVEFLILPFALYELLYLKNRFLRKKEIFLSPMDSFFTRLSTLFLPIRIATRLGRGSFYSSERRGIITTSYRVLWSIALKARKSASINLWFRGIPFTLTLESSADFALIREIFLNEEYRHPEIPAIKCIFDVGANVGVASIYFHCIYPHATIYAFEPDPLLFEKLFLRVSNIPQIIPLQIALSDRDGETVFYRKGGSPLAGSLLLRSENAIPVSVKTRTISSIASELGIGSIGLLKFDVEGAECMLFDSSQNRECAKRIIGEVHLDLLHMSKQEFAQFFPNFNLKYVRQTAKNRYIIWAEKRIPS